jgi:hypothetical protein
LYNEKGVSISELCIKQNSRPIMKNNSQNYLTNSRVGRRWSKETLNDTEHNVSTPSDSSTEGTKQDPNY